MLIDSKTLRAALGRFTTGVTIATCRSAAGDPVGLTVNSFNALSLDPPLVLWSLRAASPALPAFRAASHFAINVLAEAQIDVSRRFASPAADRFADGPWHRGAGEVPVLDGCAAVFECRAEQALEAGDHVLFIGRVVGLQEQAVAPLVFQAGHYHQLGKTL